MNFGEDRSGVGYALYVRDNIKKGDYFRTTTGEIFKMEYIKGNQVFYAYGGYYWVDIVAINVFSPR